MSGGSSGGTTVDDEGFLIGIPTQGSELDCRPGDTNRDGAIDLDDVGCIPTGGSLGHLRPIKLALGLLDEADADIRLSSEATGGGDEDDPTAASEFDLPRLALNLIDLERQGLDNYAIAWGQLTDADGAPALLGVAPSWSRSFAQAGLQEVYALSNEWMLSNSGEPRFVSTFIWRYDNAEGAREGYDLVERRLEGMLLVGVEDDAPPPGIGEESALSRWLYVEPQTQREMATVELSFRVNHWLAAVSKTGTVGSEDSMAHDVRKLATVLHERLLEARPVDDDRGGPLSHRVVRLVDGDIQGNDYYLVTSDGSALPLWWRPDRSMTDEWQAYWDAVGVQDAYFHEIGLPAEAIEADVTIETKVYRFAGSDDASTFVDQYDEDLRWSGATNLQEQLDVPAHGNESRSLTFEIDLWPGPAREHRVAVVVRVGDTVATVETLSESPVPVAAVHEIAKVQADCLQRRCAPLTMPVPFELDVAEPTPEPTIAPSLTATALPAHPPTPAATPRPSPTPVSAESRFTERRGETVGIAGRGHSLWFLVGSRRILDDDNQAPTAYPRV